MVEANRNVPRDQRQKFYTSESVGETLAEVIHPGLPNGVTKAYKGDIEMLGRVGLLALSYQQYSASFDITPLGFRYYEYLRQRGGQPIHQMSTYLRNYLDAETFRQEYPLAHQKWAQAEAILWSSDSEQQLTTIGHLCREALQEFAMALVNEFKPTGVDEGRAHTVSHIRAVLDLKRGQLGTTQKPFLDALLAYWGSVSDLVQRQEHGAQRDGRPLVWEDGRRVVFQTAIVMFEISNSLAYVS